MILQPEQRVREFGIGVQESPLAALIVDLVATEPGHRVEIAVDDDLLHVADQGWHVVTPHLVLRGSDEVPQNAQSAREVFGVLDQVKEDRV